MCFTGWLGTKEWESNIISTLSSRIEFVAPSMFSLKGKKVQFGRFLYLIAHHFMHGSFITCLF